MPLATPPTVRDAPSIVSRRHFGDSECDFLLQPTTLCAC